MKSSEKPKRSFLVRWAIRFVILSILFLLLGIGAVYALYQHISPQLPNISVLQDVKYQIPLMVYSRDGKLIAQFGEKKRFPVNIDEVPKKLIQAFLAAEDDRFFEHPGVDYKGLLRAGINYVRTGEKRQGGSTITMQVARNFFLTPEKTFIRKIKEIFLALKIEQALEKNQILELYLNKIYLGHRSYGINAAGQIYYGKNLNELNLAQMAMIAGLPKAPSRFNPVTNPDRAATRRDYVLRRMQELRFISESDYQQQVKQPVSAEIHTPAEETTAPYIAEMVREHLFQRFGANVYTEGYKVYTTIDSKRQANAQWSLRDGLHEYDQRHGFRGVENTVGMQSPDGIEGWRENLRNYTKIGDTIAGIVVAVSNDSISVLVADSEPIEVPWKGMKWARPYRSVNRLGKAPKSPANVVKPGDIIRVRQDLENNWQLAQVPVVEGALVAIDPNDGNIVALIGGFDFFQSKYNRATQAKRQPGSAFKPILYTKALEEQFTAASIINDAPVVFDDPALESEWRPENYSGKFFGPTRLRVALRNSRNLVSIRLMRELGVKKIIDSAVRFGLPRDQLPKSLSLALGSGSTTVSQLARVYAVFANGGFLIDPYFIDRIETAKGEVIFQAEPRIVCSDCYYDEVSHRNAPRVMSPQVNFIMNSLLQDVIRNGTGRRALKLNRKDIAGKTGTTNEQRDGWFSGYNESLVAVTWVGFDSSKPLGNRETGGKVALPIWIKFMQKALKDIPELEREQPERLETVRIDSETGLLASADDQAGILEIFRVENIPESLAPPKFTGESGIEQAGESEIESLF